MEKNEIINALNKRALGYDYDEVSEEYACDKDGASVLTKRRVSVHHLPPDMTAIKILLDIKEEDGSEMTDSELEAERIRLLSELALINNKQNARLALINNKQNARKGKSKSNGYEKPKKDLDDSKNDLSE